MIPKKPETIIKEVAEENDLSESMVDDIVGFYYKELRKKLSSLEDIRINIPGLGHFLIKKKSVDNMTKKYTNLVNKYNSETFSNYHNKKLAEAKLEKLKKASKKIDEFLTAKKIFKHVKQTKTNMEEPETDC
jgi:nucleoid DNA-binding protein